jgi:hypothetical protein
MKIYRLTKNEERWIDLAFRLLIGIIFVGLLSLFLIIFKPFQLIPSGNQISSTNDSSFFIHEIELLNKNISSILNKLTNIEKSLENINTLCKYSQNNTEIILEELTKIVHKSEEQERIINNLDYELQWKIDKPTRDPDCWEENRDGTIITFCH